MASIYNISADRPNRRTNSRRPKPKKSGGCIDFQKFDGFSKKPHTVESLYKNLTNELDALVKQRSPESAAAIKTLIEASYVSICLGKPGAQAKGLTTSSNIAIVATDSRYKSISRKALRIMRQAAPNESAEELRKVLDSTLAESTVNSNAVFALAYLGTNSSVWPLLKTIDQMSPSQRHVFVNGLGFAGTKCSKNALAAINKNPTPKAKQSPVKNITKKRTLLDWTVLPKGFWKDPEYLSVVNKINARVKNPGIVLERLRFMDSLGPRATYEGKKRLGSVAYWVFVFDDHVVAECPLWGNAAYVVEGTTDWKVLLSKSKKEVLEAAPEKVERIYHANGWKTRLTSKLNK